MKLNLLPTYVSKEKQNRLAIVLMVLLAGVGIAAAVQLTPLVDYVDLDGAALLADDPFAGPGLEPDGRLRFNTEPGLGVTRTLPE